MGISGAAQEAMMWGGATSNGGAATGVYGAVVTEAALGMSKGLVEKNDKGEEVIVKHPRPYIELEFAGKNDPDHPAKNGKKITKQKFYGPTASDDADKKKLMAGMLKRSLGDGFGIKWATDGKPLDPRIFIKKECFLAIGPGKENEETKETRQEILAIAPTKKQLPKKFLDKATTEDVIAGEETTEEKPKGKPSRR